MRYVAFVQRLAYVFFEQECLELVVPSQRFGG